MAAGTGGSIDILAVLRCASAIGATLACLLTVTALYADPPHRTTPLPAWAYPMNPPGTGAPAKDAAAVRHVPDSRAAYTTAQVSDMSGVPDWHPEEHPPAPSVVTRGRPPAVYPCGHCHRITGSGGPENAKLAGLPAAYIRRQLEDYRSGARTTAVAARYPQMAMIALAKALTPPEMDAAAQYFSARMARPSIRVIEAAEVPRTHVVGWRLAQDTGEARESIGQRIIEFPDVPEDFESRDSHATFTAYVPPGSLERGKRLATTGAEGKSVACTVCHGAQLQGLGVAPPIDGRSPSYLVRQLYEIQTGIRHGADAAPMRIAIAALDPDDLIAVAAFAASLP